MGQFEKRLDREYQQRDSAMQGIENCFGARPHLGLSVTTPRFKLASMQQLID
jgi:hypothetical protein